MQARKFTTPSGEKVIKLSPLGWWCIDAAIAVAHFIEGDDLVMFWN